MKKQLITIVMLTLSNLATGQGKFELKNPPDTATLLAEGFISTSINERDFALSADGTEVYYTIATPQSTFQTIVFSKKDKNGKWSGPEVVSFAGKFSDLEPALSADGKKLYFASNRPLEGSKPKDFDIWLVERNGNIWGEPKNVGAYVNTESDEFYPSITKSGNLYFTAQYKDGVGREDIFLALLKMVNMKNRLLWIQPSTPKVLNSMPLLIPMKSLFYSLATDEKMTPVAEIYTWV